MSKAFIRRTFTLPLFSSTISLSTVFLFAPGTASALDFGVQPRLSSGAMYYEFQQDPLFSIRPGPGGPGVPGVFTPSSERSFSDLMPFVGGGATFFVDKFFLDVYAQKAFSGNDQSTFQGLSFISDTAADTGFEQQQDADWDREEYAVSAGYSVTDNFALFAGYRYSDTQFDQQVLQTNFDIGDGVITGVQAFSDTLDYQQDGPFVGGKYSWRISDAGSLAFNLGIAFVNGDLKETIEGQKPSKVSGDTVGTTLGLSWTAPLPVLEGLNYTVGVDGYQYRFKGNDTETVDVADFSETIVRASAGVSYLF